MEEPRFVWKDGQFVAWADAVVHIADSVAAESGTVLEELRCFKDGKSGKTYAFRLDDHIERLRRAASASMLGELPASRKIARGVADVVAANGFEECCIRLSAARRGRAMRFAGDPSPDADGPAELSVVCWRESAGASDCAEVASGEDTAGGSSAAEPRSSRGIAARISSWRMGATDFVQPQIRSAMTEGFAALSRKEARSRGADEAVILDAAGFVCCSTCGNVFVVRDGVLSTPPLSSGAHDGVMRDAVLNLAMDMDIPAIEEQLTRTDLYMADEAFLADDIAGVVPMSSVDSRRIGKGKPGSVTEALRKRFGKASSGALPEYSAWLTEIPSSRPKRGK